MQLVEADAVKRSQMVDKVELAVTPSFWNFYIMGEVHPFNYQPFWDVHWSFAQCIVHVARSTVDLAGHNMP